MLLQRLLLLLPEGGSGSGGSGLAGLSWVWWAVLVGAGMLIWLAGSRVSRSMITLGLVAAGAIVGKQLPGLVGFKADPAIVAIAGAVVLGVAGYALHRWIIGLALGWMLAAWTALGLWMTAESPTSWSWPAWDSSGGWGAAATYVQALTVGLGGGHGVAGRVDLAQQIVGLGSLAVISGIGLSVMFPRLATALLWTLVGTTLAAGSGVAWCFYQSAHRLDKLPATNQGQLILLGAIVGVGLIAQVWQLRGGGRKAAPAAAPSGATPVPA